MRKNLKKTEAPAVEDVFESFAQYVESLSLPAEATTPATRKEDDMVYIFQFWRHNLCVPKPRMEDIDILASTTCIPSLGNFSCGQPTVLSTPKPSRKSNQKPVTTKKAAQLVKSFKAPKPAAMDLKKTNIEPKLQELIKQTHQESAKEAVTNETTVSVEKASTEMVSLKENAPTTPKPSKKETSENVVIPKVAKDQHLKEKKSSQNEGSKDFVPSAHSQRQIAPEVKLDVFLQPVKVQKSYLEGKKLPVTTKKSLVEAKKSPVEQKKVDATVIPAPIEVIPVTTKKSNVDTKKSPAELKKVITAAVEVKKVLPQTPEVQKALPAPLEVKPTPPVTSTRKSPKTVRKVKLDYTCESFFNDWIHNLTAPEPMSPVAERKPKVAEKVLEEEMFEDDKDSRRRDFAKVAKIKDKKRAQAERKSINKRIK